MLPRFTQKRKIKIGVAPLRRTAWAHKPFNQPEAVRYKNMILEFLKRFEAEDIEFVDLEGFTDDGLLSNVADADRAAAYFISEQVDGVFVPHCNFGSEESLAHLAKAVGKPVLIWGPKDYVNPDDFYRYRDSQCGLFASSKMLNMFGVPFSYIENCDLENPIFEEGFRKFAAVVSTVRAFRELRIGQIGPRPAPFASVKCNEIELLQKFGIEIIPMTMEELKTKMKSFRETSKAEIEAEVKRLNEVFVLNSAVSQDDLEKIACLKLTVEKWAVDENLSAAVAMCWGPMIDAIGISPCFVLGDVCNDGFPFICESDIHGAVTAVLAMAAARYTTPIFLADMTIRHPENKNAELMWHCGVFAKDLAKENQDLVIGKHYNRLCPAVGEWQLKDGDLSVVRFDGMTGDYSIFLGNAKTTEGPKTVGAYVWIEVDDWSKWEHKLIYGPYIHHCVGIYADVIDIIKEACRYIPGLTPDCV